MKEETCPDFEASGKTLNLHCAFLFSFLSPAEKKAERKKREQKGARKEKPFNDVVKNVHDAIS